MQCGTTLKITVVQQSALNKDSTTNCVECMIRKSVIKISQGTKCGTKIEGVENAGLKYTVCETKMDKI